MVLFWKVVKFATDQLQKCRLNKENPNTDQHRLRWNKAGFLYPVADDDDTFVTAQSMLTKFFWVSLYSQAVSLYDLTVVLLPDSSSV
jgi:hypothetical protein